MVLSVCLWHLENGDEAHDAKRSLEKWPLILPDSQLNLYQSWPVTQCNFILCVVTWREKERRRRREWVTSWDETPVMQVCDARVLPVILSCGRFVNFRTLQCGKRKSRAIFTIAFCDAVSGEECTVTHSGWTKEDT